MDVINIKFKNWSKYNPRKDIKRHTWFALSNSFFIDPVLYKYSDAERLFLILLLCETSRAEKDGAYPLTYEYFHRVHNHEKKFVDRTLEKLRKDQVVEIRGGRGTYANVRDPYDTLHNTTLHNTTLQNTLADSVPESPVLFFDFDALYKNYPRKEGKSSGLKQCIKQIKTQEDYDALAKAIDRYTAHCLKTDQIRKHFSSFMGSEKTGYPWREWLDTETGAMHVIKQKDEPQWIKEAREKERRIREGELNAL